MFIFLGAEYNSFSIFKRHYYLLIIISLVRVKYYFAWKLGKYCYRETLWNRPSVNWILLKTEHLLMVRWIVGLIPLTYFSFQPVLHDWCTKCPGMCYPVCGMVHIKEPMLLIDKSSLCDGSRFPFSLSERSLTICLTPYNRR